MKAFKLKIVLVSLLAVFAVRGIAAYGVAADGLVVVIDPGHGGRDAGACRNGKKEKDINLDVSLRLGRLIKADSPEVKVVYTRTRDVYVPLGRRAEIANKAGADLFISIHTNSVSGRSRAHGAETYTLGLHRTADNLEVAKRENSVILIEEDYKSRYAGFNPKSSESYIIFEFLQDSNLRQSVRLAKLIQSEFRRNPGIGDRGVHQAGFLVLRETSMPSVLVELGYVSNPSEARFLASEKGAQSMARSIYNALRHYLSERPSAAEPAEKVEPAVKAETAVKVEPAAEAEPADRKGPVFAIQILTSGRRLAPGSRQFRGLGRVDYYKSGRIYKYICCKSSDYDYVCGRLPGIRKKFKDAFIVAFSNGGRMNVRKAEQQYRKIRQKR